MESMPTDFIDTNRLEERMLRHWPALRPQLEAINDLHNALQDLPPPLRLVWQLKPTMRRRHSDPPISRKS